MEYKNMNRKEEHYGNGDCTVENQDDGELIQNHANQTGGEGGHDQRKQQPPLCTQPLSVHDDVDKAQQQEQDRCHFVNKSQLCRIATIAAI